MEVAEVQSIKGITCIVNGIRPLNNDVKIFIDALQDAYRDHFSIVFTEYKGHGIALARNSIKDQGHLIIAIGGDGTFNEIVNGVLTSDAPETGICLIPNGTGNDFCRAQKMVFDKNKLINAIRNPKFVKYDVGQVSQDGQKRYFLNVMDAGFGGYTTMILDRQRTQGITGGLSYSIAILRTFFLFKKPIVEILLDSKPYYKGKMMMVAVSNSCSFANGLIVYPASRPDDGILGVTTFRKVNIIDYILNLSNLRNGRYIIHKEITYATCTHLQINVINGIAPVETDGEIMGRGSATIAVLPTCLKILQY